MPMAMGNAVRQSPGETHGQHDLDGVTRDDRQRAFDCRRASRPARQQGPSVSPAEAVIELIAQHPAQPCNRHHGGEVEAAAVRGEPGQQQHGFTFQQGAEEYREQAVAADEQGDVHAAEYRRGDAGPSLGEHDGTPWRTRAPVCLDRGGVRAMNG